MSCSSQRSDGTTSILTLGASTLPHPRALTTNFFLAFCRTRCHPVCQSVSVIPSPASSSLSPLAPVCSYLLFSGPACCLARLCSSASRLEKPNIEGPPPRPLPLPPPSPQPHLNLTTISLSRYPHYFPIRQHPSILYLSSTYLSLLLILDDSHPDVHGLLLALTLGVPLLFALCSVAIRRVIFSIFFHSNFCYLGPFEKPIQKGGSISLGLFFARW